MTGPEGGGSDTARVKSRACREKGRSLHRRHHTQSPNRASSERDGTTTVINTEPVEFPVGTRIEIRLGSPIPSDGDGDALFWAKIAITTGGQGKTYSGKTSPWWYDAHQFHELLYARGKTPVRELVAHLDGCTGARAGEIVAAARLGRTVCSDITLQQAAKLLQIARENAKPVTPERLGSVGPILFADFAYACTFGTALFGAAAPLAVIPFVVESWACKKTVTAKTHLIACVNRTPSLSRATATAHRRARSADYSIY
jgi:hypothetical protein